MSRSVMPVKTLLFFDMLSNPRSCFAKTDGKQALGGVPVAHRRIALGVVGALVVFWCCIRMLNQNGDTETTTPTAFVCAHHSSQADGEDKIEQDAEEGTGGGEEEEKEEGGGKEGKGEEGHNDEDEDGSRGEYAGGDEEGDGGEGDDDKANDESARAEGDMKTVSQPASN